jgi:predicted nuclease of predicted toxin-antitoxin system
MNILLDECTPRVVKKRLSDHNVRTVQEMGWAGYKNGELLTAAEGHFEVFITTDKNLPYQQNLAGRKLAVFLLPSNQVPIVEALILDIKAALSTIKAGDLVSLSLP